MMRVWASSIFISIAVAGCGSTDSGDSSAAGGGCSSGVVGSWSGVSRQDRIEISGDKSFKYSGPDGCVSQGSYACPPPSVTSGTMRVTVDTSSGGACLPAGNFTCAFALNGNAMGYDCTGTGQLQYRK
jgi:hypothetical protein